ncbi:hypothetical protein QUF63_08655 [Anaerolineales bacterium HSG25]|nr:hypothetical protein [Anaerolineales bacterium HSG25]
MPKSSEEFAKLLTKAVREVSIQQTKKIQIVQKEIGLAVGRKGGTALEHWRKGNFPRRISDVENLTRELVNLKGLPTHKDTELFLDSAGHPAPKDFSYSLFPDNAQPPRGGFSPFVTGWPIVHPNQFFGRSFELKLIFDLLRRPPMQNIAILSARRGGKTSLLHYLKNITATPTHLLRDNQRANWLHQPENYQWVMVEFEDARMGNRERLFRHILQGLGIEAQPDPYDLYDFLDAISENLERPSIILMDEIGYGLASPELDQEFWWSLRSLSSNQTQGKLAFILTAKETPNKLADKHGKPSPFFNIFGHTITLEAFKEEEARSLIANSPIQFSAEDEDWIIEQSGCWPAPLQLLSHNRLATLEHGDTDDRWRDDALQQLASFQHLINS